MQPRNENDIFSVYWMGDRIVILKLNVLGFKKLGLVNLELYVVCINTTNH